MVAALAIYCSQVLFSLISSIFMLLFFVKMTGFDEKWSNFKYKGLIKLGIVALLFLLLFILRKLAI